jgi:hypothetical protein
VARRARLLGDQCRAEGPGATFKSKATTAPSMSRRGASGNLREMRGVCEAGLADGRRRPLGCAQEEQAVTLHISRNLLLSLRGCGCRPVGHLRRSTDTSDSPLASLQCDCPFRTVTGVSVPLKGDG